MRPDILLADTKEDFRQLAAREIARRIRQALESKPVSRVALSGGSTPRPVYETLARRFLRDPGDFRRVHLYFSDERLVPPEDAASNYRMVRESLLNGGALEPGGVHPVETSGPDPRRAAEEYGTRFPESLDLLLLGMGTDGHTASLFPGSKAVRERARRVVAVRGGDPDLWRVTITPRVIEEARSVLVLVSGEEKAETVRRAIEGPYDPVRLPVQLALGGTWVLDRPAASALRDA